MQHCIHHDLATSWRNVSSTRFCIDVARAEMDVRRKNQEEIGATWAKTAAAQLTSHTARRTRHELQAHLQSSYHHGHVALLNRPRALPDMVLL
jgi:hypothetical protein